MEAWDAPVAEQPVTRIDLLPGPHRRVSPVEHALRQLRHQAQPATPHTLRNLIILVAILVAATGLTIWMTQGMATQDTSSGPTSAQRSPAEEPLTEGDWESLELENPGTTQPDDRWAWGETTAASGPPRRAPAIHSWPPGPNGSVVPGPGDRLASEASPSEPFRQGAYPPGHPQGRLHSDAQPTPVANLNPIEPPPLRR